MFMYTDIYIYIYIQDDLQQALVARDVQVLAAEAGVRDVVHVGLFYLLCCLLFIIACCRFYCLIGFDLCLLIVFADDVHVGFYRLDVCLLCVIVVLFVLYCFYVCFLFVTCSV